MHHAFHPSGAIRRARAVRCLAAAGLLVFAAANVHAALIEIPVDGTGLRAVSGSWQERIRSLALPGNASSPAPGTPHGLAAAGTINLARVDNAAPGPAHRLPGAFDRGLPAHDDAPFGPVRASPALGQDSETELWTVLLVGAGLIAYQIRRKARAGSIRVRPL